MKFTDSALCNNGDNERAALALYFIGGWEIVEVGWESGLTKGLGTKATSWHISKCYTNRRLPTGNNWYLAFQTNLFFNALFARFSGYLLKIELKMNTANDNSNEIIRLLVLQCHYFYYCFMFNCCFTQPTISMFPFYFRFPISVLFPISIRLAFLEMPIENIRGIRQAVVPALASRC